jgi:hypothetical protein
VAVGPHAAARQLEALRRSRDRRVKQGRHPGLSGS